MTGTKVSDDLDRRSVVIFVAALISLWFGRFGIRYIPDTTTRLAEMCWWAGTQIVSYLIVPLIVVRCIGMKPIDIGWKFRVRRVTGSTTRSCWRLRFRLL